MSSTNSTYEQRLESKANEHRIISDSEKRRRIWVDCLRERANFSLEMVDAVENQAERGNHHKPLGLFFNRMDWVEQVDSDFCRKAKGPGVTTKQGSLIESVYYYGRGIHIDPEHGADYPPVSIDAIVDHAVDVLIASDLDEDAQIDDHPNLKSYVHQRVVEEDNKSKARAP